jgi:flagellar hook-associated protein 2
VSKTSLADVRDAINASREASASIIKADDNSYYLSLTSRDTGTSNEMTITTDDAELAKYVSYDPGNATNVMSEVPAADAKVNIVVSKLFEAVMPSQMHQKA